GTLEGTNLAVETPDATLQLAHGLVDLTQGDDGSLDLTLVTRGIEGSAGGIDFSAAGRLTSEIHYGPGGVFESLTVQGSDARFEGDFGNLAFYRGVSLEIVRAPDGAEDLSLAAQHAVGRFPDGTEVQVR